MVCIYLSRIAANDIRLIIIAIPQEYQPRHHRIRCQGHILNLATNAFLSVSDVDQIDGDNTNMQQLKDWKKIGAFRQTPQPMCEDTYVAAALS